MTYLDEESDCLATIQETVVVGESQVHHLSTTNCQLDFQRQNRREGFYRANFDLAVHDDGLVLDSVETQHGYEDMLDHG